MEFFVRPLDSQSGQDRVKLSTNCLDLLDGTRVPITGTLRQTDQSDVFAVGVWPTLKRSESATFVVFGANSG